MIRNRQPFVHEIVAELDNPTMPIGFVKVIRDGRFKQWSEPAELWIEAIGGWLRCDGSYGSFALNGSRKFGRDSRNTLRAAIDRWIDRSAHENSLAYDQLARLLVVLSMKHFPERSAPIDLLPTTVGLVTQIDNLTTALVRKAENDAHHARSRNMG